MKSKRSQQAVGRAVTGLELLETRRLLSGLVSGQTVAGTISSVGEIDEYTFTANAGETAIVTLADTGATNFAPVIEVLRPDGVQVAYDDDVTGANVDMLNLPQTGTYTVRARDYGNDNTGNYALSFAKVPGAQTTDSDSGPISISGEKRTGTISLGDFDVYTFTAGAGNSVIVTLADTANDNFSPVIQVFGPGGAQVGYDDDVTGANIDLPNLAGGTYTVVVRDYLDDHDGSYAFNFVRAPAAQIVDADSGPIGKSGQMRTGTIELGDLDVYTFTAGVGNSITVTAADTANDSFSPIVQVFAPNGAQVGYNDDVTGADITLQNLTQTGTYTVVVRDYLDDNTGTYALSFARAPGEQILDADSGPLTVSGLTRYGSLPLGDLDVFNFSAGLGDSFAVTLADTGAGNFSPAMWIYKPDGSQLAYSDDVTGADIDVDGLTLAGTYTVVIADYAFDNAGNYALTFFKSPGSHHTDSDSHALTTSGETFRGHIATGDLDLYTVSVAAGESFVVTAGDIATSSFDPVIEIYRPDGVRAFYNDSTIGANVDTGALTMPGTYTVVVRDYLDDNAGSYALSFFKPTLTPVVSSLDNDGGAIASGQSRAAAITVADLDVYTLSLNAGAAATIQVKDLLVNTFDPRVDLYSPTGALVSTNVNANTASITVTNAPATGVYKIVVRDSDDDNVGNYAIAVDVAPGTDARAPEVTRARFEGGNVPPQLVFTLNESIGTTLATGDLTLQNLTTGQTIPDANLSATFNAAADEINFRFPGYLNGVLPDGNYRATLNAGSVSDLAGNALAASSIFNFAWSGGTSGDDVIKVQLNAAGTALQVYKNSATPTLQVSLAQLGFLSIAGLDGNDSISVDLVNGNPVTTNGLSLDGGIGTDALAIVGSTAANNVAFNQYDLAIESRPMSHSTFEGVTFDGKRGLDNVTVNTGAIVSFPATQQLASLTINPAGLASMAPNGSRVLSTRAISIGSQGMLDLNDNDLIFDYTGATAAPMVQALISAARNGGGWDSFGITSSFARNAPDLNTTLGVMESTDWTSLYGSTPFDGETLDGSMVLVKYTWYADTDFNGQVDFDDYIAIDFGFNNGLDKWLHGDADGNGFVDFDDIILIDLAFNTQSGVL